jgi:microcin C transport system permease protein
MMAQLSGFGTGKETAGASTSLYQGNKGLDQERVEQLKKLYGFDKPPLERFVEMMRRYLDFDFGHSYYHHMSVAQLVISKLPVSMSLGLWSFLIVYSVCIPLGIAKAVRDGSTFDVVTSSAILVGYGSFWNIFPLRGLVSDHWRELSLVGKVLDYLWHMVLPITASTVGSLAVMTLLTKNSFLEEIRKQYVVTARAKGLEEHQVLYKHVFRNAIIPIITGFPGSFITAFFTGSLLIETIFSLDGMGLLAYESVMNRDYPVVLGTLYFFTIIGLFTRLLSDLSYVLVDPRISFESRQ